MFSITIIKQELMFSAKNCLNKKNLVSKYENIRKRMADFKSEKRALL